MMKRQIYNNFTKFNFAVNIFNIVLAKLLLVMQNHIIHAMKTHKL